MKYTLKRILWIMIVFIIGIVLVACDGEPIDDPIDEPIGWDGESITYAPEDIADLNAAIPQGYAILNAEDNDESAIIKSLSPELDNYGGIATGVLSLDFNYAVIFQMDVVSVYTQYIVKLFVEGETDSFYVLSDDGQTGLISVNVVDSMLSDKYRERRTSPDPGYDTGWKYANQKKNCYFYIMPKGPDGEIRTAELILRSIKITNYNAPSITEIAVTSTDAVDQTITRLKDASTVALTANVLPATVQDKSVVWHSEDPSIASVSETGMVSFVGVGKTQIYATSTIDQSKKGSIYIDVLSGYENKSDLINYLSGLNFQTNPFIVANTTLFDDVYRTTWSTPEEQKQKIEINASMSATRTKITDHHVLIDNYFNPSENTHIIEAQSNLIRTGEAGINLRIAGNNTSFSTTASATIYRKIGSNLYKEIKTASSNIQLSVKYAETQASQWQKSGTYTEEGMIVWGNQTVSQYRIVVKAVTLIKEYTSTDFLNTQLWQNGDVEILAAGSVRVNDSESVTIREENQTKYPYGGIVSELIQVDKSKPMEIIIDVVELNPTRVFWDLRMLYFQDGIKIRNPLKVGASNQVGSFTLPFNPVYDDFKIYLIANGSDIGVIAEGAEIKIRSIKLQYIDD